jgi:hypothetical protein
MERSPDVMTPAEKLRPLAHQNFEGRMDALIKQVAGIALKKLKPAPSKAQQVAEEVSGEETKTTAAPRLRKWGFAVGS